MGLGFVWRKEEAPVFWTGASDKCSAMTYSCMRMHTTIGAVAFHFRVRDGIGWCHNAIVTEQAGEAALERLLAWVGNCSKLVLEGHDVVVSLRPLEVIWSSHTDH